jgi:hypothetical protein
VEQGAVTGVHGDDLESHAVALVNAADNAAAADLSCRSIQQELHATAKRHGVPGVDEETAEGEAVHVGDVTCHARSPGHHEGSWGTDAGVFA